MAPNLAKGHLTLFCIYLFTFVLGIASANPVVFGSAAKVRSLSIANSTENFVALAAADPGGCREGEALQYSECGCNNIITSYCWSPDGGIFGSTINYKLSCSNTQQCMPSIGLSSTAKCVEQTNFNTFNVLPSSESSCQTFTYTGYGSIQVVSQVIGGCPATTWPSYVSYNDGNGNFLGSTTPSNYYYRSPAFGAGNTVETCVVNDGNEVLTIVSTVTPEITDSCAWCG